LGQYGLNASSDWFSPVCHADLISSASLFSSD
jgi:hypothetical protein